MNLSNMNVIKINRNELLEAVRKNRGTHREDFLEAQKGYREEVVKELDRMLEDARKGNEIKRSITLPEPKDHTKDYDRAIRMLEMCVSDIIEVTEHDFNQYVMDDWGWKRDFAATVANYKKGL